MTKIDSSQNALDDVFIHLLEQSKDDNDDNENCERSFWQIARIEDDYSTPGFVATV